MTITLGNDGKRPAEANLAGSPELAQFRELVLYVKKKNGLLNQIFAPNDYVVYDGDKRVGEFAGGYLEMENRRLACAKHVLDRTESMSPTVFAVMEPGEDIPVFQRIKHRELGFGKQTNMLQFIRSVPNSRIWKRDRGYSIHDEPRNLVAQILIDDDEMKPPEPGVALIHLRQDLDPKLATELVATLLTLTYLKS